LSFFWNDMIIFPASGNIVADDTLNSISIIYWCGDCTSGLTIPLLRTFLFPMGRYGPIYIPLLVTWLSRWQCQWQYHWQSSPVIWQNNFVSLFESLPRASLPLKDSKMTTTETHKQLKRVKKKLHCTPTASLHLTASKPGFPSVPTVHADLYSHWRCDRSSQCPIANPCNVHTSFWLYRPSTCHWNIHKLLTEPSPLLAT